VPLKDRTIIEDGVNIPLPLPAEEAEFEQWLTRNDIKEPFHVDQHYDYVSAFRAGIDRDAENAHFPDTYKLPGHPTFSIESQYYKPGMKAGYWKGDEYIPIKNGSSTPQMDMEDYLKYRGKK